MESNRFARLKRTTARHLAMEVQETLRRITEFPDNPDAMDYFYKLFENRYNGQEQNETRKPMIGTMCVQVPEELIMAASAAPVRLCSGAYSHDQVGADFMPAKSCPLLKATAGMLHIEQDILGRALNTVIIPTTCDQKKKGAELLKSMGYPVHILEMPAAKESDNSRFYWQESVKQLCLDLGRMTGSKVTKNSLRQAIHKTGKASAAFRKLSKLRQDRQPVILGKDIFLVNNGYFFDDIDQWTRAVERLVDELENRRAKGFRAANRHSPRILFTGSPPIFPNLKVPLLVEQAGAIIVADEVCSANRLLHDSVAFDEPNLNDMVPALADRYLKPCTCPCMSNNSDRTRKLKEMAQTYRVDGIVYQSFSGCLPYEMEQTPVSSAMAELDLPVLNLETDYSPEDLGQLSTRIEAFIESIKARRRKKK